MGGRQGPREVDAASGLPIGGWDAQRHIVDDALGLLRSVLGRQ